MIKYKNISFKVDEGEHNKMKKRASDLNMSLTEYVRTLIKADILSHCNNNSNNK